MADLVDNAQIVIEQELEASLSHIKRYEGVSAVGCFECGDDIPEARRAAIPGCKRCTECESMVTTR